MTDGYGRVIPVVNHVAGTLVGTGFCKIESQPSVIDPQYILRVNTKPVQGADACVGNRVFRQRRYKNR